MLNSEYVMKLNNTLLKRQDTKCIETNFQIKQKEKNTNLSK